MLTFLTERHICVYKRDIDNALGKYRKYMVGEPELMNGAINEFVNARLSTINSHQRREPSQWNCR